MHQSNKIIQALWVNGQLNVMQLMCIKSFIVHGHEFHLYTYNKNINAPDGTFILDANEIVHQEKIFLDDRGTVCAFADMFRYKLLYEKGGWWVDMDLICLKPFDFESNYIFASEHDPTLRASVAIGAIKAPKHSELMEFCTRSTEKISAAQYPNIKWGSIGSRVVESFIASHSEYKDFIQPPHVFCPLPYFCYNLYFMDLLIDFTPQTYSVHLWNEMLRLNRVNPELEFHFNSYYQRVKKLYL
jgi:hypothetical protein